MFVKVNWKEPGDTKDIFGKKIALYEVEGAERNTKKGPMLVIAGPIGETLWVLGVGFVPDDDQNGAGAIMKAIESLADAPAGDASKAEDKAQKAEDKAEDKAQKAEDKAQKADDKAQKADDKAQKADDKAQKAGEKAQKADEKAPKADDKAQKAGEKAPKASP